METSSKPAHGSIANTKGRRTEKKSVYINRNSGKLINKFELANSILVGKKKNGKVIVKRKPCASQPKTLKHGGGGVRSGQV